MPPLVGQGLCIQKFELKRSRPGVNAQVKMLSTLATLAIPSSSRARRGTNESLAHRYRSLSAQTFIAVHPRDCAAQASRRSSNGDVRAAGTETAWMAVRPSPAVTGRWLDSDLDKLSHLARTSSEWVLSAEAAFERDTAQACATETVTYTTLAKRKAKIAQIDTAERWGYDHSREPMYAFVSTNKIKVVPGLDRISDADARPSLRVDVAAVRRGPASMPSMSTAAKDNEWTFTFYSDVPLSVLTSVNAPIGLAIADIAHKAHTIIHASDASLTTKIITDELKGFVTRRQKATRFTAPWRSVQVTLRDSDERTTALQSSPICGLLFDFPVLLARSVIMTGKMLFLPPRSRRER